ncbi:MAG: dehydrogenase, partial [Aestuariivirga sp.]
QKVLSAVPVGDAAYDGKVALVVDCSGHEKAVLDGCKVVRKKGEVVLVGVPWKAHTQILAHEILNAVFFSFAVLRSGWEWEVPIVERGFVWEELYEGYNNAPHSTMSELKLALDWLAAGKIPLDGLVTSRKISNPQPIYDALMARTIAQPFVVLDWQD